MRTLYAVRTYFDTSIRDRAKYLNVYKVCTLSRDRGQLTWVMLVNRQARSLPLSDRLHEGCKALALTTSHSIRYTPEVRQQLVASCFLNKLNSASCVTPGASYLSLDGGTLRSLFQSYVILSCC